MKHILLILSALFIFSCTKEVDKSTQPATPNNGLPYLHGGSMNVYVNSNFRFPTGHINRLEHVPSSQPGVQYTIKTITLKEWNPYYNGPDSAQVHKTVSVANGEYEVYTCSTKNANDPNKNMTDNKPLWNRLTIVIGSDTVFDKTNLISTSNSAQNIFHFNVN